MSRPSTFKTRFALSACLTMIALAVSGCSLTSNKPDVAAATTSSQRPASAAEAMQQAVAAKPQRQANNPATAYVDPLVSARPGRNQNQNPGNQTEMAGGGTVRDFRASGRSAAAAMRSENMRSEKTPSAKAVQPQNTPTPSSVPEMTEAALAGVVTQPTGIQAGRNSIFSAAGAPAADIASSGETASAPHVSSASGSLSTDAVAYAPVRRISGTTGGLFAGGPQMASGSDTGSISAPVAANHAPPGIATRPIVPAAAQPPAQGLW